MNTADLMEALGAAEENDIEASAGELPAAASPRKPWLRWGAVAAVWLCFFAAMLLLRYGDRTNNTTTMPSMQDNRTETFLYEDGPQLTMQSLYVAYIPNPFLSLPEEIPLLTAQDWEIPQERQTLYFVAHQPEEEISGMFHMIREAAKMYRNAHPEVPRIEYADYSPVFSLSPDGSPAEREWILPDVDMGRIRGIFTAAMPKGPGKIQVVYTKRDADSEDWIARLEGLAQYSSPESPVCFLRNEKIGLMGLVDEKAYLICPAKGDPFPPSSIAPAQYVPDDETLAVERLDLSGRGIPVRYHAELTPEQLARYKDILLSEEDHPYRVRYDLTGMSEEEIREYFEKVSNDQSPAVTAANYLDRNVTVSTGNGVPVYREEYGGAYLWENRLCVLIPRQVEGAEAYLKSLFEEHFTDRVFFRSVEYSYNELLRFQKQEVLPALQENGIRLYMMGPDEAMNCVTASVSERDLVRCCELILEKGWVGRIRLERMDSEPVFTED